MLKSTVEVKELFIMSEDTIGSVVVVRTFEYCLVSASSFKMELISWTVTGLSVMKVISEIDPTGIGTRMATLVYRE